MGKEKIRGGCLFLGIAGDLCVALQAVFGRAGAPEIGRALHNPVNAMQACGFDAVHRKAKAGKLHKENFHPSTPGTSRFSINRIPPLFP